MSSVDSNRQPEKTQVPEEYRDVGRPTHGPWSRHGLVIVAPDADKVIGFVDTTDKHIMQARGDAQLMSAAPELLIACKAALNDQMYKDWPGVADLLIAAIAKAEGRS